uniref:protein-tyrosine-phosphatase n=1 Tax=Xiphophorus couchianus TaxID=32473 RepID=A0A3B5L0C5_9TELE
MNFVDPKEYNYPGLVRKNRYKTILPNTHSRVILKSQDEDDFLSTYINANYLKGYEDEEQAYIATQGPTVNTVGDFWRMVWQERSPIIVMITNLEEKNEVETGIMIMLRIAPSRSGSCSRGRECAGAFERPGTSWPGRSR